MDIISAIKKSNLRYKKLIYIFLFLSYIYPIAVAISVVFAGDISDFIGNWLPIIVLFLNSSLFLVYLIFFFDNRQKKTVVFIAYLSLLAIEQLVLVVAYLSISNRISSDNSSYHAASGYGIGVLSPICLTLCYIILAILARKGLHNRALFLVVSIVSCIFSMSCLNIAITIFGSNNYLPILNQDEDYSLENKSDKEKLIILKEQFDNGIITEEEYKEKKKIIIDSL